MRGERRRINRLLDDIARAEEAARRTTFLAPCVRGGSVRTRVAGLVYTFRVRPPDAEGWGLFRSAGETLAEWIEEADLPLVSEYLKLLTPLRLRLVHALEGRSWLAYPANESDARQRTGAARPVAVHLVADGAPFEAILARSEGRAWWFEEMDRHANPLHGEQLRQALRSLTAPGDLRFAGLTPEMRAAYDLAARQTAELRRQIEERQAEARLGEALGMAGGSLRDYRDRGDAWLVEWHTADGARHNSLIAKSDLSVVSAGICLSGQDRRFDLQSLVGVVERREW